MSGIDWWTQFELEWGKLRSDEPEAHASEQTNYWFVALDEGLDEKPELVHLVDAAMGPALLSVAPSGRVQLIRPIENGAEMRKKNSSVLQGFFFTRGWRDLTCGCLLQSAPVSASPD